MAAKTRLTTNATNQRMLQGSPRRQLCNTPPLEQQQQAPFIHHMAMKKPLATNRIHGRACRYLMFSAIFVNVSTPSPVVIASISLLTLVERLYSSWPETHIDAYAGTCTRHDDEFSTSDNL